MNFLPRILLIEDEKVLASSITQATRNDYSVEVVHRGKLGIYRADREHYDVIILDLTLSDISGSDVCLLLRERGIKTPILILSADANPLSKITLLDAGANDYLTKPFSLGELKARLRAIQRHKVHEPLTVSGIVTAGD